MPNHRTLRRLTRTGHPTLLTVAGHRGRAVPAAPPQPPPAVVATWCYSYDRDGNCIDSTEVTSSLGTADAAVAASHRSRSDGAGHLLGPDAEPAADCLPFQPQHWDAEADLCCGPYRCGCQPAPDARWLLDDPLLLDPAEELPATPPAGDSAP